MDNLLLKTLLNIRSLRAFSKEVALEQLEEAHTKLGTVILERREQEEKEEQERKEREQQLAAITSQISKQGIDVEALISALQAESKPKSQSKRAKRDPVYEYYTEDGEYKTWTGQGRTPTVIQNALDHGQSLDFFKIKKPD